MKTRKTVNRSISAAERRRNEDRRNAKRRAHPRVAIVPVPTDRRREERRDKKK